MSFFLRSFFLVFVVGVVFTTSVQAQDCPSAKINDVVSDPVVVSAMDAAWSNSKEGTVDEHIEGFNIYQCANASAVDGNVFTTEIDWGDGNITSITYPFKRENKACRLVGNFHTHPGVSTSNPMSNDPYENDRPSQNDLRSGLPGIIRFGLGPIASASTTVEITYGPEVSPNLAWKCEIDAETTNGNATGGGSGIGTSGSSTGSSNSGTTAADTTTTTGATGIASTDAGTADSTDTAGSGDNGADTTAGTTDAGSTAGGVIGVPRPVSYTDPHLITIDGLAYSFQAIGEFVLAESALGTFTVQARQKQTEQLNSQLSMNEGFAFKVDNDEVALMFNISKDLLIFINNIEQTQPGDVLLPGGGRLSVTANDVTINWADGSKAVVDVRSSFMNLSLWVADVHKGKLSGLLGNYDGDYTNDMVTNFGVDISVTPQADELYGFFAEGWRVTDENSLFVYFANENTAFFTNRLFPGRLYNENDLSDIARARAATSCANAGVTDTLLLNNCILDVGATNNVEFATAVAQVQRDLVAGGVEPVQMVVQGRLEIPDVACSAPALVDGTGMSIPDVAGQFNGTLTNPDLSTVWDATIEIEQCGASVNGLLSLSTADGLSFKRRFEGDWAEGRLSLNVAFPYSYNLDVGQTACVDVLMTLTGDINSLEGSWVSSNCVQGGLIAVVRDNPVTLP